MKINELDKNAGVTQSQLDTLESVLDKVFSKVGIDIEFTRHFIDRVNDERNVTPISIKELAMLFKKEFIKYGKPIAQLGPDAQAVMKDLETDINIPFVLNWNGEELELVAKTVMRKKDFKSSNKEFAVETTTASLGSKINFPGMQNRTATPAVTTKAVAPITKKPMAAPKNRFDKIVNWGKGLFNHIEKTLAHDESKLDEDLGSLPPLADLIVLAVVAQTTVAGLKTMLKTALKTGKGLRKIKKMADAAGVKINDTLNPDMYESNILTDSARELILNKISSNQEKKYYAAALAALDRLVKSKGSQQTVGGYAFDIARSFNGMNAKDLVAMYDAQNETLDEAQVKQSNPLVVLDKVSDRSDNNAFPVKFYDDTVIKITPKKAKKFMDAYYKMADEQRDIINKYIKTKKGFMQAINDFNIPI
jgi:hypothetical protein